MDPIVQSYWNIHRLPTPLSREDHPRCSATFSRPISTLSSASTSQSSSPRRQGHRRSHAISLSAAPASPAPQPPVEVKAERKRRIRFSDDVRIVKHTAPLTPPLQASDADVMDMDMGALTLPSSGILNVGSFPDSPRSSISGASTGLLFEDLPTPDTARSFFTSELEGNRKHVRAASQDLVDRLPTEPALMEDEESVKRWERLVGILRGIELHRS